MGLRPEAAQEQRKGNDYPHEPYGIEPLSAAEQSTLGKLLGECTRSDRMMLSRNLENRMFAALRSTMSRIWRDCKFDVSDNGVPPLEQVESLDGQWEEMFKKYVAISRCGEPHITQWTDHTRRYLDLGRTALAYEMIEKGYNYMMDMHETRIAIMAKDTEDHLNRLKAAGDRKV